MPRFHLISPDNVSSDIITYEFEWDEIKATANLKMHKISFDEAQTVFADPLFLIFADTDHSLEEDRFIIMGESVNGKSLWWPSLSEKRKRA
jgi:uncharacterized DUF497 family protein